MQWRAVVLRTATSVAGVQVLLAGSVIVHGFVANGADPPLGQLLMAAHVCVFAGVGTVLLAHAAEDERAPLLGAALLLIGAVFAASVTRWTTLSASSFPFGAFVAAVFLIRADALIPFYIWEFVREFPRGPTAAAARRRMHGAVVVSLALGALLIAANGALLLATWIQLPTFVQRLAAMFAAKDSPTIYFTGQLILIGAALVTLLGRSRRAPLDERRRALLLSWGLAAGLAPAVVWTMIWAVIPAFERVLPLRWAGWIIYPALLSVPISMAYAVLVRHALDVRLVVRRALQYGLARYSVLTLAAIPSLLVLLSLYRDRDVSLARLATRPEMLLLLAVLAASGTLVVRFRPAVLQRIDRHFFREHYDAGQILAGLVERCRQTRNTSELASVVCTEVDRALHVRSVRLLLLDDDGDRFASTAQDIRPLARASGLAALLAECAGPLDVDVTDRRSVAGVLAPPDVHWLVDGDIHLLVPLRQRGGALRGMLALGEKRSELPFTAEDRALLSAVASAAELALGHELTGADEATPAAATTTTTTGAAAGRRSAWPETCASECVACGLVQPAAIGVCPRCAGEATTESALPEVVAGRFAVAQRIGAGGMGVVYEALDMQLNRTVAIKALPAVTADAAAQLRREARIMASVTHPNLAFIFGAEIWRGRPLVVMEYLAGGTLADRLRQGAMPPAAVVELGIAMAGVLAAMHDAGILHRDLKPSNIGFSADGTPKLTDFGLAWLMSARAAHERDDADGAATSLSSSSVAASRREARASWRRSLMNGEAAHGTPLYMSPEALLGAEPDASFDLWSLCVVLREALTGVRPRPWEQSVARRSDPTPTARPRSLHVLIERALSLDPRRRPTSARRLRDELVALRTVPLAAAGLREAQRDALPR